jgi:hypothetical protein
MPPALKRERNNPEGDPEEEGEGEARRPLPAPRKAPHRLRLT